MEFIQQSNISLILAGIVVFQFLVSIYFFLQVKASSNESHRINKEVFGLLKKFEGLTASKREQILNRYDQMLEELSHRLPTTIAALTSSTIVDTEAMILKRLAELDPQIRSNKNSRDKMDSLIRNMEHLESSLVSITADTVRNVMLDNRKKLFIEDDFSNIKAA